MTGELIVVEYKGDDHIARINVFGDRFGFKGILKNIDNVLVCYKRTDNEVVGVCIYRGADIIFIGAIDNDQKIKDKMISCFNFQYQL